MHACILILITALCINSKPITKLEALEIGKKIWNNECKGTLDSLVSWNQGEEFISLGIGHFIWFPKSYHGPFTQTFPELKKYLLQHNVKLPAWLQKAEQCPWQTREEFLQDKDNQKVADLKTLLSQTIELQTQWIIDRLQNALPKMINNVDAQQKVHVTQQFDRVAKTPGGFYALIDYCNFKGEGTNPKERYNCHGWGLLQVLQTMKGKESGVQALQDFKNAAYLLLEQRVKNSPLERNEQRWLLGWKKRLETYTSIVCKNN